MLISQPKIALQARVANRYTSAQTTFTWDPLLHRVEPPLCQVCGQPAPWVYLCANGHLADEGCILHCAFCKRVFCTLCKDEWESAPCAANRSASTARSAARSAGR